MNIPDDVMKRARSEFYHQYPLLPDLGLEAAAQYIAEWARKEALEEAAEVAKAWGRADEEGGYARSAFTVARKIRALAAGDAS